MKWRAAFRKFLGISTPPVAPPFDLRALCESLAGEFATKAESRGVELILDHGLFVPESAFGDPDALRLELRAWLHRATDAGNAWVRLSVHASPEGALVAINGSTGASWHRTLGTAGAVQREPVTAGVATAILAAHPETAATVAGYLADLGLSVTVTRDSEDLRRRLQEASPSCLVALVDPKHAHLPSTLPVTCPPLGAILRPGATSPPWAQLRLNKPVLASELARFVRTPATRRRASPQPQGKLCVLAVEDNAVSRKVLERFLDRLGCHVTLAADGQQAVDAFQPGQYGVVLMDCHMPVMDGWSATEAIRAREDHAPRTPILALTANLNPDDHARCLQSGMDAVLTKPITLEALRDAIAAWTGRRLDLPDPRGTNTAGEAGA
jgi:CheY-like chemotaxis protein